MDSVLTFYERQQIEFCLKHKFSARKTAKFVKRNHTVISREIKRNSSPYFPYSAIIAQRAADRRAKYTNKRKVEKDELLKRYIEQHLELGWSPEQIAGRLEVQSPPELQGQTLCTEAIYRYIYDEDGDGVRLYHYLRRAHPIRRKKYSRKRRANTVIKERVSIQQRPEIIAQRYRFGDWESDTMECGKRKTALSVQYERKAMMVRLNRLINHTAEETEQAITKSIETLPNYLWQSITFDNGPEGAYHHKIRDNFNLETYFCDPYKSWQKGGVENTIGLIRQYLPKRIKLDEIDEQTLYRIQELLNNRPRKSLNYLTPNEVINSQINGQLKHQSGALNS